MRRLPLLALLVVLLTACNASEPVSDQTRTADTPTTSSDADLETPQATPIASRPNERPIPNFGGRTLEGNYLEVSSLIGKRFVVFLFNPEIPQAKQLGRAVARVASLRGDHNFEVLGVAVGSSTPRAIAYAKELGIDFPVIDDSRGEVTRALQLQSAMTLLVVDNEGYLTFAMTRFPEDAEALAVDRLSEALRLPDADGDASEGALSSRPRAPDFTAPWLAGGDPFELSSTSGKPKVLIFFLHTCPHCHKALAFLKEQLAGLPEDKRPELIAISAVDRGSEITAALKEQGLDYFPVLLDPGQKIQHEYAVYGGFPDVLLIDADGQIIHRSQGWHEGRDEALMRMLIAKIAGTRIPMLLNPKGYTGSDVCSVCHTQEHDTWQFTKHATAFDTLVTHGADRKAECIGCHVVGFDEPGGFTESTRPVHLENVGCESCHGRGGPHLTPGFVKDGNYEPICVTCHNQEHSLGFVYEDFVPAVSHKSIAAMSNRERAALVAGRARPGELLPTSADYLGSDACKSCHEAEYQTWLESRHAKAGARLVKEGKADVTDCQPCHTTGFDMRGGYVKGRPIEVSNDLARVGCESCHGPGSDHVADGAKRIGTILSLGDKCDSCVILKVCGSCHDQDNDPGFQFEVEEHIERQRHGTIEPGTGKPKQEANAASDFRAVHHGILPSAPQG